MEYGIKLRPLKPASPHLNGKVERSQRTDLEEFYATVDLCAEDLAQRLDDWQSHYNKFWVHGSLDGRTPWQVWYERARLTPLFEEVEAFTTNRSSGSAIPITGSTCSWPLSRNSERIIFRWGFRRVGDRRAARAHVSCLPSSNRTCGFPASGSPIIFIRVHAPQSFQMAHLPDHAIQPTAFMKKIVVPPSPSRSPGTLMFAPKP